MGLSAKSFSGSRYIVTNQNPPPCEPRRAAGIYGRIITAAILAAIGDHMHTLPLTVSIPVTLVVYWLAEEYAELLGEQLEGATCRRGRMSDC